VGYKETNHFTDKLKMNPHSVVVFDEIDKAHRDIVKLLLQILENGVITDSTGKKISLKHAILILTTSLGAADMKKGLLGFGGLHAGGAGAQREAGHRANFHTVSVPHSAAGALRRPSQSGARLANAIREGDHETARSESRACG